MNRNLPLKMVIGYLLTTLSIALFGPTLYYGFDVARVVLFMTGIMIAIVIGYLAGSQVPLSHARVQTAAQIRIDRIFDISLGLALVGMVFSFVDLARSGGFNTDLGNLGSTYLESYDGYERNTGSYSLSFILYSLTTAPTFIATIWGIYYFRSLSTLRKVLVVTTILGTLFTFTIGSGKQKQLGDIIIYALTIIAIKSAVNKKTLSPRTILLGLTIMIVGVLGFTFIVSQRYAALSIDAFNINGKVLQIMRYDLQHPVFRLFGPDWGLAIAIFLGYLSQGYFGLSMSLTTPTTWSYMLGSSYSVSAIADRAFGIPFAYYHTYPFIAGVTTGWGESHWYTVFPWFASDFGFIGTIPLFGFFAYVYARCWHEAIGYENPFAILLFCLLTLGAVFMPANNQLVHSPGGLATLIVVVFLYLRFRRPFNAPQPAAPLLAA